MAKILQGIQDDNPKAEPLTEVASVDDGEDEVTYAECGVTGILKAHQRKVKKVPPPVNAEQLRFRYRVLENGYLYGRFKHANKSWLADLEPGFFSTSFADFLLGKRVLLLEAAAENGQEVPWSAVLRYEFAIRKSAMDLIKDEGLTLVQAIERAKKDEELRALYFTAYVTLNKKKRGWDEEPPTGKGAAARAKAEKKAKDDADRAAKKAKGKGGGKPKAKGGKGKNKSFTKGGLEVVAMTPDQRYICFKFNDLRGCDGSCGMVHCCRVKGCYDTAHPMYLHPGFDQSWFKE